MALDMDLSVFFDTDGFAVDATWDGSKAVQIIFDNQYKESFAGGIPVAGRSPVALVREAQMPEADLARDQTLDVGDIRYKIKNWEPDGTGLIDLQLELQD
jgi:hypothetical protein